MKRTMAVTLFAPRAAIVSFFSRWTSSAAMLPTRQPASCSANWMPRTFGIAPPMSPWATSMPANIVFGNDFAATGNGPKAKRMPTPITRS